METHYGLDGKVAIVTGGGKGIGRAIALGLSSAGTKMVIASRTQTELESVAQEIRKEGGEAFPLVTDITDNQQLQRLVDTTMDKFKRIDILVNNAARSFLKPLMDLREDGWDKIFNTNCKAPFLLGRAVATHMMDQGGGRIINITTVGAERVGMGMGAYHASKAALKMLTMSMAAEWAPFNINVNAVGPGFVRTEFSKPVWSIPEIEEQIAKRVPRGRIAEPEEVVGAVLFLASDASDFITGQTIYVDGGMMLGA
ncbi:MAG: glucose 1-dehydrogenase [Proteobacteria bacterium]|nr:glucose 1-dehydrogenase [Pseudomonadota bacterium]